MSNYTGADKFAVLDVVRVRRREGYEFAGVAVGNRKEFQALNDVRTMVFADVDDAIEYVSAMLDRDATVMHNRKYPVHAPSTGNVYAFRLVDGKTLDEVLEAGVSAGYLSRHVSHLNLAAAV